MKMLRLARILILTLALTTNNHINIGGSKTMENSITTLGKEVRYF